MYHFIFTIEIIMYVQYPNFMPSVFRPVWIWSFVHVNSVLGVNYQILKLKTFILLKLSFLSLANRAHIHEFYHKFHFSQYLFGFIAFKVNWTGKCYFHVCSRNVSGAPHLYLYNKALVCNVGWCLFSFSIFSCLEWLRKTAARPTLTPTGW